MLPAQAILSALMVFLNSMDGQDPKSSKTANFDNLHASRFLIHQRGSKI
jgi:hypothetical protein